MLNVQVGKLYNVSMVGEHEFGGPMRVRKITDVLVIASFEFNGKIELDELHFRRIGNQFRQETLRYKPERFDCFPDGVVKFKPIKEKQKQ